LSNIPLGGGPDKPFQAVAGVWTRLEFTTNGVPVLLLLEVALKNVGNMVNELASL
jgi:hypothetical protein